MLQDVNVVSAPIVAKDRGIVVEETRREAEGDYESLITVAVVTDRQTRWVSGTVYADGRPRIVNIKGIRIDAEFGPSMLYVTNQDGLVSSAASPRCSPAPASTSPPFISAASWPVATPSPWSKLTAL